MAAPNGSTFHDMLASLTGIARGSAVFSVCRSVLREAGPSPRLPASRPTPAAATHAPPRALLGVCVARSWATNSGVSTRGNTEMRLGTQFFAGSPLDRSELPQPDHHVLLAAPGTKILLVGDRLVACRTSGQDVAQLGWMTLPDVQHLLGISLAVSQDNVTVDGTTDEFAHWWSALFLGRTSDGDVCLALLVPGSALKAGAVEQTLLDKHDITLQSMRTLLASLSTEDSAVGGLAVALGSWHEAHRFCGRCGSPTVPIAWGMKRACTGDKRHRLYPRTDPVVIMLVEDTSGNRLLLGRRAKMGPGRFTCLSGFVDAAESIEEAVCREVFEESGVKAGSVSILGSQPWPIGRGGSSELMIGCLARAECDDIIVNRTEMEEVQWFERSELRSALERSTQPGNPYLGGSEADDQGSLWVPPPFAIAHSLIEAWVMKKPEAEWPCRL